MSNKQFRAFVVCTLAVGGSLLFSGCLRDTVVEKQKYTIATPIYTLKASILAGINGDPGQAIVQPGQLYIKDTYIYLNDVSKGIHIIDNSNPGHPVQTAFLNIPGNLNIAIRDNILYADMYADLLAIDISDPHQVKIVGKLFNFFSSYGYYSDSTRVLTGWVTKDTTIVTLNPGRPLYAVPGTVFYTFDAASASAAANASAANGNTGMAGSEAAMTMVGNYLYAIPEPHSISTVDITDPTHLNLVGNIPAGFDLETIFPLQDKLLVGSKEGVYIYTIDNASHQPVEQGQFKHGTACDPVIADQQYAYVTLHKGTNCGGTSDELDVLNAQDISQATLLKTYPMTGPTGLGKDGSLLFVCDGPVVKVFNASDPSNLQLVSQMPVDSANDVIAANHLLLVVAAGGLYEFDYSDPTHILPLSHLPVNKLPS